MLLGTTNREEKARVKKRPQLCHCSNDHAELRVSKSESCLLQHSKVQYLHFDIYGLRHVKSPVLPTIS